MDNDVNSMAIAILAAKKAGGGSGESIIDDTKSSENTTYSSNKIESLIPKDPEYLKVSVSNVTGNISVGFPKGYDRASFYTYAHKKPVICDLTLSFNNWSIAMYGKIPLLSISQEYGQDGVICFRGLTRNEMETGKPLKFLLTVIISQSDPTKDQVFYEELTT